MIKAATKDEVIQVAHNLFDPLLENVHRDVENLRAQLVNQEKQNEKLRAEYTRSAKRAQDQVRRYEKTLAKIIGRLTELENRR